MGKLANTIDRWLSKKLPKAMKALGKRCVAEIREEISTPYPPASEPGTPPHYRTGTLSENVKYTSTIDYVHISSSYPDNPMVPFWLEYGTKKMAARPYMAPVKYKSALIVAQVMREHLR